MTLLVQILQGRQALRQSSLTAARLTAERIDALERELAASKKESQEKDQKHQADRVAMRERYDRLVQDKGNLLAQRDQLCHDSKHFKKALKSSAEQKEKVVRKAQKAEKGKH